jgi:predicted metalloprotease with PDZ domain
MLKLSPAFLLAFLAFGGSAHASSTLNSDTVVSWTNRTGGFANIAFFVNPTFCHYDFFYRHMPTLNPGLASMLSCAAAGCMVLRHHSVARKKND